MDYGVIHGGYSNSDTLLKQREAEKGLGGNVWDAVPAPVRNLMFLNLPLHGLLRNPWRSFYPWHFIETARSGEGVWGQCPQAGYGAAAPS